LRCVNDGGSDLEAGKLYWLVRLAGSNNVQVRKLGTDSSEGLISVSVFRFEVEAVGENALAIDVMES
jgi:hypothetical protein